MNNIENFKNTLDQEYDFPCEYLFKFIVKNDFKEDVISLLPEVKKYIKISKKGKYVSITLSSIMKNADEIVYIYDEAAKINSIIFL
jgi:putative lipoic acid-binding regulatory protein